MRVHSDASNCLCCHAVLPIRVRRGMARKFCDQNCAHRFKRHGSDDQRERRCRACAGAFMPNRGAVFCSSACSYEWRARQLHDHECKICGSAYRAPSNTRLTCSPECETVARRTPRKDPADLVEREANRRRNRLQANGRVERLHWRGVGAEDGWICHLCALPVDPDEPYWSKMGPTLDHVVPVSRGGTHTRDNVKLAHRSCNSAKRDRMS